MRLQIHTIFILLISFLSSSAHSTEGYSSTEPSKPANIYSRTFTIYTLQEACAESPPVAEIKLRLPGTTIQVGDRIHTNHPDDSVVSDLIIEAFDKEGTFLPGVPVSVGAGSIGRTLSFDPGIIYRDSSMDYWEARKPGEFEIGTSWLCATSVETSVTDTIVVKVIGPDG